MNLYGTEEALNRARDLVVRDWQAAGLIDLIDLNPAHREHIMTHTKPGWDRALTIRQAQWTYLDLDDNAQGRVNCVLLNRATEEARHELV